MWLFTAPPASQIKTNYGVELSSAWFDRLRLSSIRFDNGGSGSFVSANGLAVTNHHVAATCLHGISTAQHDYYKNGFYARKWKDEPRCPDLELNVLEQITDVTAQVNAGVKPGLNESQATAAKRAAMSAIEKDCVTGADLRCDVVAPYSGALYHLYKYKKYTDVRLVFAPEFQMAYFGGDPDNFEFPRYDLDVAFFRVYENGKPVELEDYLRWSAGGLKEGDLTFVSGHPGSTARLKTVNELYFLKGRQIPFQIKDYERRAAMLKQFASQSTENARVAQETLFSVNNNIKRFKGYLSGLNDEDMLRLKRGDERRLLMMARHGPRGHDVIRFIGEIANAIATMYKLFPAYFFLEGPRSHHDMGALRGELASYARILVRAAAERSKPNGERLREYRESALPSLQQTLFSTAPIYRTLEATVLADSLAAMRDTLGAENTTVKLLLGDSTPQEVARLAIAATKLDDVAYRTKLWEGGTPAIAASDDPLILMLSAMDAEARKVRADYDEAEGVLSRGGTAIALFRFQMGGANTSPDATFTLRLSYGPVKGYTEDGRGNAPRNSRLPAFTDLAGAFADAAVHQNQPPYDLPESWLKRKRKLDLKTPFNFVSTADIIGGSSGSPVVDTKGELVGIVFDGNIQSLPWNYQYEDKVGRAVSVDCRAILETLRKIYGAKELAKELTSEKKTGKKN